MCAWIATKFEQLFKTIFLLPNVFTQWPSSRVYSKSPTPPTVDSWSHAARRVASSLLYTAKPRDSSRTRTGKSTRMTRIKIAQGRGKTEDENDYDSMDCDDIRRYIPVYIERYGYIRESFEEKIGVSPDVFRNFIKLDGPQKGKKAAIYTNSIAVFENRRIEKNQLPSNIKKAKKQVEDYINSHLKTVEDLKGWVLDGEEDNNVAVYDTCDEIRRKIKEYLTKTGMTRARFGREIGASFIPSSAVSSSALGAFLTKIGPCAGNTSNVFYGSYVFFEKIRIRDRQPKSEHRLVMEDVWDGSDINGPHHPGMDLTTVIDREQFVVPAGGEYEIFQDQFGKSSIWKNGRRI